MREEEKTAHDEKTEHEQKMEEAKHEIRELEDDPPERLEGWPDGQAKYETFGGAVGDHSYDEGPEVKLGPHSVRHHEGDPIPGGPTDPDAASNPDEQRLAGEQAEPGDES